MEWALCESAIRLGSVAKVPISEESTTDIQLALDSQRHETASWIEDQDMTAVDRPTDRYGRACEVGRRHTMVSRENALTRTVQVVQVHLAIRQA